MKSLRVLFLVTLVVGVMSVNAAAAGTSFSIVAAKTDKPPVLDGVVNDSAWLKTSIAGGKVVVDLANTSDSISMFPRVAYVAYDDKALYVAYVNYTANSANLAVGDAVGISNNDEVELFLQAPGSTSYFQMMVDAAGRVRQPDYGLTFAIGKTPIQWIVEVAVPWEKLGVAPKAGETWKINLNGHQIADGPLWVCWSPTYGSFKNPARFGEVTFGQ